MIPPSKRRRVSRLEERITDARHEKILRGVRRVAMKIAPRFHARMHAASVIALVRYGDAQIDEPLSQARRRTVVKLVSRFGTDTQIEEQLEQRWQAIELEGNAKLVSLFGPDIKPWLEETIFRPRQSRPAYSLHIMKLEAGLPGGPEKFSGPLASAPRWLLKFAGVERDADILGFKLPDLSQAPELRRNARKDRDRWPLLPEGTIDAGAPCYEPDLPVSTEKLIERHIETTMSEIIRNQGHRNMSERTRQPLGPRAHRNQNDNLRPPWKKGLGGRPPGALNHTTRAVRATIMAAADMMGGVDGMVKWIKKHADNEFVFWSKMYLDRKSVV
jgi:hypothetical protein